MKREDLIVRKSFSASHNNGELWAENLDALYDFEDVVEHKFLEDMKTVKRPSTPSIIAMNLNQTKITKHLATIIIEGLVDAGSSVRKVAFVGLEKEYVQLMKQVIKTHNVCFVYHFFDDFMIAKDWLF